MNKGWDPFFREREQVGSICDKYHIFALISSMNQDIFSPILPRVWDFSEHSYVWLRKITAGGSKDSIIENIWLWFEWNKKIQKLNKTHTRTTVKRQKSGSLFTRNISDSRLFKIPWEEVNWVLRWGDLPIFSRKIYCLTHTNLRFLILDPWNATFRVHLIST